VRRVAELGSLGYMKHTFKFLGFILLSMVFVYFALYFLILRTERVSGVPSPSRIPIYKNPITGNLIPHSETIKKLFEPAYRIDVQVRPRYWEILN